MQARQTEELKFLNEKLVERIDYLQSIINQEASANTYYYNYPPDPDYSASHKHQSQKTPGSTKTKKSNEESEHQKIKRMYEDQMEFLKKQ